MKKQAKKPGKEWKEMTLAEKVKCVGINGGILLAGMYTLNTLFLNVIGPYFFAKEEVQPIVSKEVSEFGGFGDMKFERYKGKDASGKDSSLERKTLDWLKYASMITEKNLDYKVQYGLEAKEALKQGKGDCTKYSRITYSKFISLAKKLEMPEMLDNVRLATGEKLHSKLGWFGHSWLEVKKDGKWIPYETTSIVHFAWLNKENEKFIAPYAVRDSIFDDPVFLRDSKNYRRTSSLQVKPHGGHTVDIDWYESLTDFGGFIGKAIKKHLNESKLNGAVQPQKPADAKGANYRNNQNKSNYVARNKCRPFNSGHRA